MMDVHVPFAVTKGLRLRGIDVLTAQEDGAAEIDDLSLLLRATELGRILVSQDKDLLREGKKLLMRQAPYCGIVYAARNKVTIGQMVTDLALIAGAMTQDEWRGRIEHLPL